MGEQTDTQPAPPRPPRRLRLSLARALTIFRLPERLQRPVTLSPRGLRALAFLVTANLLVLALLGVALYRTGAALIAQPPLVTVLVSATPGPSPTAGPTPTPFGSGGAVAFTVRRNGNTDIYAINQTTREVIRLTSDAAEDRDPAWSPDGQALAFASRRSRNWDVYLLDLEGGALIRLTRDPGFDAHPTWSPDGSRIAYESYRDGNLDVYVMDSAGRNVRRLTTNPAPDHSPTWSPDGTAIAFVSYRDGNQDIYLYVLEGALAGTEVNVTNSPNTNETHPGWSPDGTRLAYTIGQGVQSTIQVSTLEWRTSDVDGEPQTTLHLSSSTLFGSGSSPTWAPDGQGVVTVYRVGQRSYLIASSLYGWALSQEVYSAEAPIDDPAWGATPVSPRAIARARMAEPATDTPLYTEFVQPAPVSGPPHQLVYLADINGADDEARLSDRVDDSFDALRQRVLEETGWDYLAILGSTWRSMNHTPRPGQSRMSWHVCGRAIDIDQDYYDRDDQLVQLAREDVGNETYWRVFIRTAQQDGSMGEPLRVAPWDLRAREEEGTAGAQGGRWLDEVPSGYYVDFTTLAADYGWERVAALYRWRYYWPDIEWWHFQRSDDLTWWQCMLELFEPEEIEASFGTIPEEVLESLE